MKVNWVIYSKFNYTGIIIMNYQWLTPGIYCKILAVYLVTYVLNVVSPLKRECYPGQQGHTPLMVFGANTGTINYGVQLVSNLMYKKR